ncbi:rhs family protein [Yersinia mollaretii]|nr:rhs family protein [Yersinia mollaretii]
MNNSYSGFRQVESTMSNSSEVVIEMENGKIRTVTTYQKSGEVASEVKTIMDLSGKIVSENEYTYGNNGVVKSEINKVYNNNGKLTQKDIITNQYDISGKLVSKSVLNQSVDSKGRLIASTEKNFDGHQNLVDMVRIKQEFNIFGYRTRQEKETYDANEKLVSTFKEVQSFKSSFFKERTGVVRVSQQFDPSKNLISKMTKNYNFDSDGVFISRAELSQKFNSVGEETSYSKRAYDASGKMTSNFSYSSPAQFEVKSDQLVSAMNGFGTLNRAPVVATIGQPNRAVVRITMSDSHSPSYEPISYSV